MARVALGFVGGGNMAEAIARGVLRSGLYKPEEVIAADPSEERRRLFAEELKVRCETDSAAKSPGNARFSSLP